MNTGILDTNCDATASIELKPLKEISTGKGTLLSPESIDDPTGQGNAPHVPTSELQSVGMTQGMEMPANQALISRLLESLEFLKTKGSQQSSGATSPSPLTGSVDRVPSSPTEVVGRYDFSPGETISREHSTDCLAATVQALGLNQHQNNPIGGHPNTHGSNPHMQQWNPHTHRYQATQAHNPMASNPFNTAPANIHNHYAGHPRPLMQPPAGGAPYPQAGIQRNPQAGMGMPSMPPNQFLAAGGDPMAAFAAYHALCAGQLGPHPGLRPMFPPQPVYEECLVGIEGAYQPYCRQVISEELNGAAMRMLSQLKNLQLADPPALTRIIGKRYFCSLKEVSKVVHGSRLLIVAPDVRPSATAHIKPVRLLQMVLNAADAAGVPYVFALSRRGIGQVFGRDKSMSIVAVTQLDQVESEYLTLLEQATVGRELYSLHRQNGARRY